MPRRTRLSRYPETCRIVTCFYVDYSNAQLVFTHVNFVDLLSSHPLGRNLDSPSDEGSTLFGVDEILAMDDPKFPVLLGKSVDDDSIVVECGPEDGREHTCHLRRD